MGGGGGWGGGKGSRKKGSGEFCASISFTLFSMISSCFVILADTNQTNQTTSKAKAMQIKTNKRICCGKNIICLLLITCVSMHMSARER